MDQAWFRYADLCRAEFSKCSFPDQLIRECGNQEDIAWAVFFNLRADSLNWLNRNVPALGGNKPVVLIHSGQADQVRGCLWRMP